MEESILMWNRLESSLRNENQLDNALRFEIRDALWMLTRQWQFGEFEGEDAGTAAFVRISGQQSPIKALGPSSSPLQEFDFTQSPFEVPIERDHAKPDVTDRLEIGRHWERLLKLRLPAATSKTVIQQFRNNSRFQFSTKLPENADRAHQFQHAQKHSDESRVLLLESLASGRALDGYALLEELSSGKAASVFLPAPNSQVDSVGTEFMRWYDRVFSQNFHRSKVWNPNHLEYQPAIAFNGSAGQQHTLQKEEYFGDGIEWHGFAIQGPSQNPPPPASATPTLLEATVIPSGIRFRGMPSPRLWEIEDGQVDFGSITAANTELSKMLFAEFGLVYGNDWLVAPFQFSMGHMCRISKMVVTDVFGKENVLEEIVPNEDWAFFQGAASENGKRWLFLAGGNALIEESKPVEKVSFLRDEMANMVWGVEEIISDPYGGGRDGEKAAKQTAQLVKSLNPVKSDREGKLPSEGWSYKAGTLMAENRIPFIPVKLDNIQSQALGKRTVILQRAATPRVSDDFVPVRIRPRTNLLGYNGKEEDQKPDPLFIFEEEIPRTGVELSLVWKRVRWFDGQTKTWLARKKQVGKGEIDANFKFDQLKK
jgi:hypothetical protein